MSFENIIGYKNVRNRFDSFLSQLNDREKYASRGIAVPNGFLITAIIYGLLLTGVMYFVFGDFDIRRSLVVTLYYFIVYVIFWNKMPERIKVDW